MFYLGTLSMLGNLEMVQARLNETLFINVFSVCVYSLFSLFSRLWFPLLLPLSILHILPLPANTTTTTSAMSTATADVPGAAAMAWRRRQ